MQNWETEDLPLHAIIMTRFRQIWNPGCYSSLTIIGISLVLGFIVSFWSEIIIDYIILPAVIVGLGFILYGQFKYNKGIFWESGIKMELNTISGLAIAGVICCLPCCWSREFDSWILEKYLAGLIKPAFFMSNFPFLYVLVCNSVL